jgi:hypothetical protein
MPKKDGLVSEYLERVGGAVLESASYRSIVASMIKGHAGVYALYKGERLYYVGLASNLMGRVKHHLKDRHAQKWNKFSVYLTTQGNHIKPIESLLLRIALPVGNRVQGRLPGARDLKKALDKGVQNHQADERARLLGGAVATKRRRAKAAAGKGAAVMQGLVDRRVTLTAVHKGVKKVAALRKDGRISFQGQVYDSPSAAARAVVGRAANGWRFWQIKKGRNWVPLETLRR